MDKNLAELPRAVRESLARIRDADVNTAPAVVAARAALGAAAEHHAAAVRMSALCRERIAEGERQQAELAAQISAIDDGRPGLCARILAGASMDAEDQKQQARRADLVRRVELLSLGLPLMHSEIEARASTVRHSADAVADAGETLREALFDARVEQATKLAA